MDIDDRVVETLDQAECRHLLATARLGRLGYTHAALPGILPVRFALEDDRIVIPAPPGDVVPDAVLDAVRGAVVVFAVDSYDVDGRIGWGVTVVGPAHVVSGAEEKAGADGASHPHSADSWIVVRVGLLQGWRLRLLPGAGPDGPGAGGP